VVWGANRDIAIRRTLRALGELEITGVATTIPADIAILSHEDFQAGTHSTKWVEETLDLSEVKADKGEPPAEVDRPAIKREMSVEVDGKRFAVSMWVPDPLATPVAGAPRRRQSRSGGSGSSGSGQVTVPMQGTIVKILVEVGDTVEAGDPICVLEAMKMENNIAAEKAGTVTEVRIAVGDSVGGGDVVAVVE